MLVTRALEEYKKQYGFLKENISQVASLYKAGDKAGAVAVNAQMRDIVITLQERQAVFTDTMNNADFILCLYLDPLRQIPVAILNITYDPIQLCRCIFRRFDNRKMNQALWINFRRL